MNELKERYSKISDDELLAIAYFDSTEYSEEAINIAKSILEERGLSNHSNEIMQKAKSYHGQVKESQKDNFSEVVQDGDIFRLGKLKQAFKGRNFSFIGKWLFGYIVGYGFYSALGFGNEKGKWIHLIRSAEEITKGWLFILEVIFNIAIFGTIPVIFFIIYSLTLSAGQREKLGLSLLIPKYILIPYGISLFLFIVLIIAPRL